MRGYAFLVTRPIQYINAINIPRIGKGNTLLIVDGFSGAEELSKQARKLSAVWSSILMFKSVHRAIAWLRFNKRSYTDFFTFSDYGLRLCREYSRLQPLRIHVYEEGLATYAREELRPLTLSYFAAFLASGTIKSFRHMGDCRYVSTIYVNHVELFQALFPGSKLEVKSFSTPFMEHLLNCSNAQEVVENFPDNSEEIDGLVYLSDWSINTRVFTEMEKLSDRYSIAKLHPFCSAATDFEASFDIVLSPSLPAEIVINEAASHFKSLTVIHQCSSAVINCKLSGILFDDINLGSEERGFTKKFETINLAADQLLTRKSKSLPRDAWETNNGIRK